MTLQDLEFSVLTAIGIWILLCLVTKNKNDSEMIRLNTTHIERMKLNMKFWEDYAKWNRRPERCSEKLDEPS